MPVTVRDVLFYGAGALLVLTALLAARRPHPVEIPQACLYQNAEGVPVVADCASKP